MSLPKCLVIDPMHESLFDLMEKIGWEVDYFPTISREEIKTRHHGYDGLIVRSKTIIDRDLLGENPTIKFIGRAGAGIDNLEQRYLAEKKIRILHAAEGNCDAVGEYTIAILLSLLRNIPRANDEVKSKIWQREVNRGTELMGKTVGIIGYGNMGSAFAKRLSGFSCRVLAYDKYKAGYGDGYCEEVQMETIFNETDILSLHIPLTNETRNAIDLNYLNAFKKSIVLLNTARGEILPLSDLVEAMAIKKVSGAALDVLENEKLTDLNGEQQKAFDYLRDKSNVIFTPHIAGWTFESHVKINVALVNKINQLK
jgi:D-3-phosphoglycerate dehydrogenase